MKAWGAIIALCLLLPAGVRADGAAHCLAGFAAVSSDADSAEEIVSHTYGELLGQLGAKLSPGTLEAMRKSGEPFTVPDQDGADLQSLQRRMKDFEALVVGKGWKTPEVTTRLLADLDGRLAALGVATERAQTAMDGTWKDIEVSFPYAWVATPSPDGRHLLSTNCPPGTRGQWSSNLLDLKTGTVTQIPGGVDYHEDPHFSPDGKQVFFSIGGGLKVVPFANGQLDWSKADVIGEKQSSGTLNVHRHGPDPDWIVSGSPSGPSYVFNFKTKQRYEVDTDTFLDNPGVNSEGYKRIRDWNFIPGKDEAFLLYDDDTDKRAKVVRVKISPTGKLTYLGRVATWKFNTNEHTGPDPGEITYSTDGKVAYSWGRSNKSYLIAYPTPGGPGVFLKNQPDPKGRGEFEVSRVTANPNPAAKEVAALFHRHAGGYFVEIYDTDTQEVKGKFELPKGYFQMKYSADGASLLANTSGGEDGKVLILNHHQRKSH